MTKKELKNKVSIDLNKNYNSQIDSTDLDLLCIADALEFFDFVPKYNPPVSTGDYIFPNLGFATFTDNHGRERKGNSIRIENVNAWGEDQIEDLKAAISLTNQNSKKYAFFLSKSPTFDFEFDEERTYSASFCFYTLKKLDLKELNAY